jgi:hypothetical protein
MKKIIINISAFIYALACIGLFVLAVQKTIGLLSVGVVSFESFKEVIIYTLCLFLTFFIGKFLLAPLLGEDYRRMLFGDFISYKADKNYLRKLGFQQFTNENNEERMICSLKKDVVLHMDKKSNFNLIIDDLEIPMHFKRGSYLKLFIEKMKDQSL